MQMHGINIMVYAIYCTVIIEPMSCIEPLSCIKLIRLALMPYSLNVTHFITYNKMKKEVGMLLQKRADTRAVGIYKLYEENTH